MECSGTFIFKGQACTILVEIMLKAIYESFWSLFGLMPTPDSSGEGYEPSPLSKILAIDKKTDYKKVDFSKKYSGEKKILVICTEERYMLMENGKKFSSGNHPVEISQPLMVLEDAGFKFDVATPTGKPACIEMWAQATKDETFMNFFNQVVKPKCDNPLSLAEVFAAQGDLETYVAFFFPGGQGAMLGLPEDETCGKLIEYVKEKDLILMSVCHGPAGFLACKGETHPYSGYKIACFPDAIDKQTPFIGYLPGKQTWYYGEKLIERGLTITNTGADDTTEVDRNLITGASPKACQKLGVQVAEKLLEKYV